MSLRCDNCLGLHETGESCLWLFCPLCEERWAAVSHHRSGRKVVVCCTDDCQYKYEVEPIL